MSTEFSENQLKRIHWHCRRGMKELDLLLIPYFESSFLQLDPRAQHDFVALLDEPDPVIYAWLMHQEPVENERLQAIVESIRTYHTIPAI